MLDLVLSRQPEPRLINVVHPRPTSWDTIIKQLNDATGANLPIIPYTEWFTKVEAHGKDSSSQTSVTIVSPIALFSLHGLTQFLSFYQPAVKLLDFFRSFNSEASGDIASEAGGFATFATDELLKQSGAAYNLKPLGPEHVQAWLRYWNKQAFLN